MSSSKPKSPSAPSSSFKDCYNDTRKLYDQYSHGKFAKAEIASTLGVSATSGPTSRRIFSIKEFGLLSRNGGDFSVSADFLKLHSSGEGSAEFKNTALTMIKKPAIFRELLDGLGGKLPSLDGVAKRLETQNKFNPDNAKKTASVIENSLRFIGVLDQSNNIVPPRNTEANPQKQGRADSDASETNVDDEIINTPKGLLKLEIPLENDRVAVVNYPSDLTQKEATKIGNVLGAIVA